MGYYTYDCEVFCEDCAPEDAEYDCSGESDCPENCSICHQPLDYSLTSEGIQYVLQAIKESLNTPEEERNKVHECYDGTYYEGSRHVEIVRDWAKDLKWYGGLTNEEEELIEKFLEETEE